MPQVFNLPPIHYHQMLPLELNNDHITRLDYLDLQVNKLIHFIEIKMMAEFDFDHQDGILSIFPIFVDSFACMVRRRKFRWDRVQLPDAMLKKIAALDEVERQHSPIPDSPLSTMVSKRLADTNISDLYIFPDPLPPAVVLPPLADDLEYVTEDRCSSTSSISTLESSLSCSTITSPHSTRSSLHSLSEDDTQERALLSQPLIRVPTRTQSHGATSSECLPIPAPPRSSITQRKYCHPKCERQASATSQSTQTMMSPSATSSQSNDTSMTSPFVKLSQPVSRPFVISPLSPPLKSAPISPTMPTST
ncbi:hypothetical protein EDB19DRAFT_1923348 [Suillus lakei]|nr:hypothetical protein EDB19DRAFT_1923348 [Suillus lakei]